MLWNPDSAERPHEFEDTAVAARALGIELESVELRNPRGLEAAFAALRGRAEALFLQTNQFTIPLRAQIVAFTTEHRLPTITSRGDFVEAGTLMSYGPSFPAMHRRAGYYVDRVLNGTRPADLRSSSQPPSSWRSTSRRPVLSA